MIVIFHNLIKYETIGRNEGRQKMKKGGRNKKREEGGKVKRKGEKRKREEKQLVYIRRYSFNYL